MDPGFVYEIIGYIASVLVAISLMMSSILKLRVINLIGAAFFTLYGLLIGAYPVAVVNFIIVLIDLYYLYEIYTAKEYFRLLEVRPDSKYLEYFLNFYDEEIHRFLPNFSYSPADEPLVFFILRDMVPAGLFIGERRTPAQLFVKLDFVIPGYRDFKIGNFLYGKRTDFFKTRGIQQICSEAGSDTHAKYLERMGFVPGRADNGAPLHCLSVEESDSL